MAEKKGFFSRLAAGLTKTRDNIASGFDSIFKGFSSIDDDFYEELEEIMIMSDMGIDTTMSIIENLKKKVKEEKIKEPEECRQVLIDSIKEQMKLGEERCAGHRRQWCRQDYIGGQNGIPAERRGEEGHDGGGGYIPRGCY
jgi:signal recognition particle GTPase